MKSKRNLILAIIIMLLLTTACNEENGPTTKLVDDETTDIRNLDLEELHNVTFEDVEGEVTRVVNQYVEEDNYLSTSVIRVMEEELAVDHHSEVKKFNNINVNIEFRVNLEEAKIDNESDFTDYADKAGKEIKVALDNEIPLEFSRVETLSFHFTDYSREQNYLVSYVQSKEPETLVAFRNEESEAEKLALEKTFEVIGEDKESYILTKFGIRNEILWIDFIDHISDIEANQTIEELSQSLYNLVSSEIGRAHV